MGHHEGPDRLNLGFGFIYYALVRALRPKHVVVIGSGYGFSVVAHAAAFAWPDCSDDGNVLLGTLWI